MLEAYVILAKDKKESDRFFLVDAETKEKFEISVDDILDMKTFEGYKEPYTRLLLDLKEVTMADSDLD